MRLPHDEAIDDLDEVIAGLQWSAVVQRERRLAMEDDWPLGAVAMTKNLDLLTDEPLELAVALRKLAEKNTAEGDDRDGELWSKFAQTMAELVNDLQALHEPQARDEKSE